MPEKLSPLTNSSTGLDDAVRQQLEITLIQLVPMWCSEPPADWKRVVRPTGEGTFSINIEPYRGARSWINFRKKNVASFVLSSLEGIIREKQPALLGYVSHLDGSQKIQDVFSLAVLLCQAAVRYTDKCLSESQAIQRTVVELNQVLATNTATQEILTALSGLKLPADINRIELAENVCLRRLTIDEISELGSNDISDETRFDITSKFVTTALVVTREVRVTLSEMYINFTPDFAFHQANQDQIDAALCALHILKTGRVGVVASFTTIRPTVLPNMSGRSSVPLVINPYAFMELSYEECESFVTLYKKVVSNRRDEVRIAATRLLDAESRLSPVDSLLDAVIGLEALLNPNDYAELSFRVALNYAYMGNPDERRRRYENVRDIQKTRNRVVHGGLNLRSKDAALIHEHADLAKKCLRDSVTRFLTDESFTGQAKLDADFWLDRVIPPNKTK